MIPAQICESIISPDASARATGRPAPPSPVQGQIHKGGQNSQRDKFTVLGTCGTEPTALQCWGNTEAIPCNASGLGAGCEGGPQLLSCGATVTSSVSPGAGQLRKHAPFAEDSEVHTIYSQVQRVEVREPSPGTGVDARGAAAWVRAAGKAAAPRSRAGCALVAPRAVGFGHWVSTQLVGAEPGRWRDRARGGNGASWAPGCHPPAW